MASSEKIPVVDLSACAAGSGQHVDPSKPAIQLLGDQIIKAMETTGFLYLVNHGIPAGQIQDARQVTKSFFSLPSDVKQHYARTGEPNAWHGWVALEREGLNRERPHDYKEAFNDTSLPDRLWPDEHVPGFREKTREIHHSCRDLAHILLQLMGVGLKLENYKLFSDAHDFGSRENASSLRLLYFPGLEPGKSLKPNQLPCGEYASYGSVCLIFQDRIGGLQVRTREGVYVPVPPVEGGIVLALGHLMQRWTSDRLGASMQRVVELESEAERKLPHYAIIYYVQPDFNCVVEGIDESHKYPPITSAKFLEERFKLDYE